MFKPAFCLALTFFLFASPAFATDGKSSLALQTDVDHVWTITAAALVFFMQAGFLLLEAGSVRSKNSVNVAQKNLMDFIVSTVIFGAFGYMLMFGTSSYGGLWGWQPELLFFGYTEDWSMTFFIFQLMFCGTAATIMSGAVAERMSINGYLFASLMIALLIYPVAGHWAWGGLLNGSDTPFLASMGFMDFAGSTVVHSVGAWVALAAIIIIGPRIGKFDENGKPRNLHGHSPVLATVGAIILWVGWIGFNGGSVLSGTGAFASVIANTVVAGGAGGLAMLIIGRATSGLFKPETTVNGLLGGLVAITASADVMTTQMSFLIGSCGGIIVFASTYLLEHILKLDDPLGAIPVHGFAGAFGTLIIPFLAPADTLLAATRFDQFIVQLTGVGAIFAWAFGVPFVLFKAVHMMLGTNPEGGKGLRVPELFEREGLNQHEHDAPMGTGILQEVMAELVRNQASGGVPKPVELEIGDEAYEISVLFNRIIQNIAAEKEAEENQYQTNKANRLAVEAEIADVVEACGRGDFSKRLGTEGRKDFLLELCNGINRLCETTEEAMTAIQASLRAVAAGDLSRQMDGSYKGQLKDIQTAMNATLSQLSQVVTSVNHSVVAASQGDFTQSIDLDGKSGFVKDLCAEVNALCDISERGLSEMFEVLTQVGEGDLTASMSNTYQGRFAQIGQAVGQMNAGISDLLISIEETALQVSTGSQKISASSAAVASGSEIQSHGIADTAKTLTDLAEASKKSASEARSADENCRRALESAESGVRISKDLDHQIGEIQGATHNIIKALEQIEVIAKQTNLLSLNASVEAVRGGDGDGSTEGFKVVAKEIRALADRSGIAAADIRARVGLVQEAVDRGVVLVSENDKVLIDINAAVSDSSAVIDQLASAGLHQVSLSDQISSKVSMIAQEADANLQLANESAQTCKQLDADAAQNIKRLSGFKRGPQAGDMAA